MVKRKREVGKQYIVRMELNSAEALEMFKKLENIFVVLGKDSAEFYTGVIERAILDNEDYMAGRTIVKYERLVLEAKRLGFELSRLRLQLLRKGGWAKGQEYFVAPNGKMNMIRYDLNLCLPAIERMAERIELRKLNKRRYEDKMRRRAVVARKKRLEKEKKLENKNLLEKKENNNYG